MTLAKQFDTGRSAAKRNQVLSLRSGTKPIILGECVVNALISSFTGHSGRLRLSLEGVLDDTVQERRGWSFEDAVYTTHSKARQVMSY